MIGNSCPRLWRLIKSSFEKDKMTTKAPVLIIFLKFIILMVSATKSFGQHNPAGYISIDCGSGGQSIDSQTKLLWVDDESENYTMMGKNGFVQNPDWVNATSDKIYPGNYQALQSFRYFPYDDPEEMMNKYCYELRMPTSNVSFILRAMFLHGNSTELILPIQFDVYVNATHWKNVTFTEDDDLWRVSWIESIFFSPYGGNLTNVCLVPNKGVPFISSLELRQLDSKGRMYANSFVGRTSHELYFTILARKNYGPYPNDTTTIRYPDDQYDRLWISDGNDKGYVGVFNGTKTALTDLVTATPSLRIREQFLGPDINGVPVKVMNDAYVGEPDTGVQISLSGDRPSDAGALAYSIFYSAIINETIGDIGNQTSVNMNIDGTDEGDLHITTEPSQRSFFHVLASNFTTYTWPNTVYINALECFQQQSFLFPTTGLSNVLIINLIKKTLNITTWQGDPCIPVPYDWIGCQLGRNGHTWWVTNLMLSNLQDISSWVELIQMSNFWGTNVLDIYYMSITKSKMNTNTFKSLLQSFFHVTSILVLDVSYNDIDTFPHAPWWIDIANQYCNGTTYGLYSLDLSYNRLATLPRFGNLPFSNQTRTLNLSSNHISSEYLDLHSFSNLSSLQVLNISNNSIQGNIPWSLSLQHLPSLQILDISKNKFSGTFPSTYYPLNTSVFFQLNADDNGFTGTLDLGAWYKTLETTVKMKHNAGFSSSQSSPAFEQMFSFVNNKISSIQPTAKDFQPLIETLINSQNFNQSGVLLGGNPYCKGAKDFTQKYLCRSSFNDIIQAKVKKNSNLEITLPIAICGGVLVLLLLAFFTASVYLLRKKVQALKRVENELSNRRVQPLYFSYHDLKIATNSFSNLNELGRGSFGVVYKGILGDETTIAVKRLFNFNKKQVLNEFLNEVVLITGIKHKNLIQLKGCCIENEERILVYRYAENGNVEGALWGQDPKANLTWRNRFKICVGVANGLTYLHEELIPRIIHRDIKPANILLDSNLNPQIADFGLAKHFLEEVDVHVTQVISGTRGYFAPEYISEGILSSKVDVFAFGILVLEIVSGRKCFDPLLPPDEIQLRSWAQNLQRSGATLKLLDSRLHSDFSELEVLKVIDIALMCVNIDPELRPTMSEVETMLLEGHERVFDILSATALKKGDDVSYFNKLCENLGEATEEHAISTTLFSGGGSRGSQASRSTKVKRIDHRPFLSQDSIRSDWETFGTGSEHLTSVDARAIHDQTPSSLSLSLSERFKSHRVFAR